MNSLNRSIFSKLCHPKFQHTQGATWGLPSKVTVDCAHAKRQMTALGSIYRDPAAHQAWTAKIDDESTSMPETLLAIVAAATSCVAIDIFSDVPSFEYFSNTSSRPLFPTGREVTTAHTKIEREQLQDNERAALGVGLAGELPILVPLGHTGHSLQTSGANSYIRRNVAPLENEVASQIEFKGLNAAQFFEIFFGDDAPFSFESIQKERGDIEIVYGKWAGKGSVPTNQATRGYALLDNTQERTVTFKTLSNSYFCSKYASAEMLQQVTKYSDQLVVLESRTQLKGVPFCDRFQIVERWTFETQKHGDDVVSHLSASVEVQVLQTFPFEGQLRKRSAGTVHEIVMSWCDMAKEALGGGIAESENDIQFKPEMVAGDT